MATLSALTRVPELPGLRGIAISLVGLKHYFYWGLPSLSSPANALNHLFVGFHNTVWFCTALASSADGIKALTLSEAIVGTVIFFVQVIIWTRINDRLPPEQQIGWRQALYGVFIWFQEGGLLVRYARLYPQSCLGSVFRVLWGIFWVLVARRVLAK